MSVDESGSIDTRRLARILAFEKGPAAEAPTVPLPGNESTLDDSLVGLRDCVRLLEQVLPSKGRVGQETVIEGEPSPEQIGRFTILGELGRGGFGVVLRVYDPTLKRQVALKVPRPEFLASADAKQRFLREGWAASRLEHPNIVQVLEAGEIGPIGYIASSLCDGPSLASWLSNRATPVSPALAARIVAALAGAIEHAHGRDVLHRDLKPSNVLLHRIEREPISGPSADALPFIPRLCDFGLAKLLDQSIDQTRTGAMLGSPPYMAPEQVDGRPNRIGPAADLYSLGVILYELLTGRPPFRGETSLETLRLIVQEEPPSLRSFCPGLARDLETITLKCLEKQPERRYPTAISLAEDLERYLDGRPIKARPSGLMRRSVKWARRHPSRASLVAVCALTGVVISSALIIGQWWQARQNARLREVNARLESTLARAELSEQDARRRLFGSLVRQAQVALDSGHDELTFDLLQSARVQDMNAGDPGFAWSHLDYRLRERLTIFEKRVGPIAALEVSPDGQTLASLEFEGALIVRSLADGRVRWIFEGPVLHCQQLAFSPDGRTLALLYHAKPPAVILFDVETGRPWEMTLASPEVLYRLLFAKDGRTLAGLTRVFSVENHRPLFWDLSKGPTGLITPLDDQEGPGRLGMVRDDPSLRAVVDILDGKPVSQSSNHEGSSPPAWGIVMTADRTLAAIGYGSSAIELWDHQGAQVATVIPFGRSATLLISDRKSPRKEGLKGWGSRVDRLRSLAPPDRHANEPLRLDRYDIPHRFAPAGDILAYQGMYAQPRLIDLKTGSTAGTTDMGGHLSALAFSPDAKSLILGGNDSRIRVQALVPPDGHDSFPAHAKEVWGIAWSPDGKSLATSSDDGTIKTWDLDAKGLSAERAILKGHVSLVTSVAWSPDGRFLASSGYNRDVRVWEAVQGTSRAVFKGHEGIVRMIAWSPDGRTLASCGNDRAVRFWDPYRLDHSPPRPPLHRPGHGFLAIAWSPDGKALTSVGLDGLAVLWDVQSGKEIRSWNFGTQVFAVAHASDGRSLAAALLDGTIRVWDSSSSSLDGALILRGHARWARTLAFSPDGKSLASGGIDQSVRLWDPSTGQELAALSGHTAQVNRVAFSPDGRTLASGDHDGFVRLWRSGSR